MVYSARRNTLKFYMKYGFDPHLYADGWALALNDHELVQLLGVHPSILEDFRSAQMKSKVYQ